MIPLDRKKLYLFHGQHTEPIELLPFIRYFEASEAIYFYMSIEGKDTRWVSYHYDKTPEILEPAYVDIFKASDFLKKQ